ncbi:S8 family serine peptidase [Roseateles sp. BYS180W]|uniref:S8 family serine peptidase n=1 Tax=Roseateles rivi TaxID=3299028 RepID=A0ABW7FX61_9BURK
MTHQRFRLAALAAATLALSLAVQAQEVRRPYIVQLVQAPVAAYSGGVAGLSATKPTSGTRLDVSASDVQAYVEHLQRQQSAVLQNISPEHITQRYNVVLNGFAANLTDAEVRELKKNSQVLRVEADEMLVPHTSTTPSFLGLNQAAGLWEQLGGQGKAGEDMIIAMVDSGVWPENLSFADRVDANGVPTRDPAGTLVYGAPPAKWKGIGCELKPGILAQHCNNKLLGIRSFVASTAALHASDYYSGRDGGGHGSHTLSTAGGNANVAANIGSFDLGIMSGIAPRARLAAYKTCYTTTSGGSSCASSSSVASIEQAVADGVDVINYSVGPSTGGGSFTDSVSQAFLNAANAGVFVSASAGNNGPATYTASNLGPWLTTVAASTHNRLVATVLTLGNGTQYLGGSLTTSPLPATTLVAARDAGMRPWADLSATDREALRLCFTAADRTQYGGSADAALDPAKVTGKVVLCERGTNARVNKSAAVATGGGVGMVLADDGSGRSADAHSVPSVHLSMLDGRAVLAYAQGGGAPTAAISGATVRLDMDAPITAGFSSRGPNAANASVLKPDVAAPGVMIAAAYAPSLSSTEVAALKAGGTTTKTAHNMISGTSMAAPHVAGLAALLKQRHPDWSPAMIKSALMTTAGDLLDDGVDMPLPWSPTANANGRLPWARGAGHVRPNLAADPGLVYDAGALDYAQFLCGLGLSAAAQCQVSGSIQPHNLNLASLTASSVLGSTTLTRTVTHVGSATATYTATTSLPGYNVVVSPASMTLEPGQKQSFTVQLTRTSAPMRTWTYGDLTWSDGTHTVKSPLIARAQALAAPASVYAESTSGSKTLSVGTGFSGPLVIEKSGLKAASRSTDTFSSSNKGAADSLCAAGTDPAVRVSTVTIPANTTAARWALYNADTSGAGQSTPDDLDLFLYNTSNKRLAQSTTSGSNETITLVNPAPGTYKVCVVAYSLGDGRTSTTYSMSSWMLNTSSTGGGFKALAPGKTVTGGTASVGLAWSGLAVNARYLGLLNYKVDGQIEASTLVEVFTNDPLPTAQSARAEDLLK